MHSCRDTESLEMERTKGSYSIKNILILSRNSYLKRVIEKIESVIKWMRWTAYFHENSKNSSSYNNEHSSTLGLKTRKYPQQIEDLNFLETDLQKVIKSIRFRKIHDDVQDELRKDISQIEISEKAFIPAYKATSYYTLDKKTINKTT